MLSARDVNEIADAPAGTVQAAIESAQGTGLDLKRTGVEGATSSASPMSTPMQTSQPRLSVASISRDGKVTFEATKNFENVKS